MSEEQTPNYHEQEMSIQRAALFARAADEVGIALSMQFPEEDMSKVRIGFFNLGGHTAANAMFDRVASLESRGA